MVCLILSLFCPDLDECKADVAKCKSPALCVNTYGSYRCICNSTTDMDQAQECILGEHSKLSSLKPVQFDIKTLHFCNGFVIELNGTVSRSRQSF